MVDNEGGLGLVEVRLAVEAVNVLIQIVVDGAGAVGEPAGTDLHQLDVAGTADWADGDVIGQDQDSAIGGSAGYGDFDFGIAHFNLQYSIYSLITFLRSVDQPRPTGHIIELYRLYVKDIYRLINRSYQLVNFGLISSMPIFDDHRVDVEPVVTSFFMPNENAKTGSL